MPEPIEYAGELVPLLPRSGDDKPLYARTPHGTYWFVIESVEHIERDAEDVCVLVLREVKE